MKKTYNHNTHSYEYAPTHYKAVERLANMRGVHNDNIGNHHFGGLFPLILVACIVVALLCKATPASEVVQKAFTPRLEDSAFLCIMGECL